MGYDSKLPMQLIASEESFVYSDRSIVQNAAIDHIASMYEHKMGPLQLDKDGNLKVGSPLEMSSSHYQ